VQEIAHIILVLFYPTYPTIANRYFPPIIRVNELLVSEREQVKGLLVRPELDWMMGMQQTTRSFKAV
jgi:hypothetical protein